MDLQLHDKTAFISGSTAGIGYAIASLLLKEGATVIINGRTQESVDKAITELKENNSNTKVSGIAADFANRDEVENLVNQLPDLDILINNVGTFEQMEKQFFQNMRPTSLLQRFASTEEVANMVVYLVSPLAAATNGAAIHAEGGLLKGIV